MSKAEEIAVRAYTDHEGFTFKEERKAFVKGYEQAEKDTMEWVRHYILSHDTVDIFQMEDAFNDERRNKK